MTTVADLLTDLTRPWKHGEHVDARGLILDEPLVLDGLDIRGFDLSGARLNHGFSARGTRFRGISWLRNVRIDGACTIEQAHFRMDFRADGLVAREVGLNGSIIQGVLSLAGSRLNTIDLQDAVVMANLTLEDARIAGSANLKDAEILGGLWTVGASIRSLDLSGADISGRIRLSA